MTTETIDPARPYVGVCPACGQRVRVFGCDVRLEKGFWTTYPIVTCPECGETCSVTKVEVKT